MTLEYKHFNHHHEMTDRHELVDYGDGEFIANIEAIPLLSALNQAGIKTRTHHFDGEGYGFVGILLDNVTIEVRTVNEGSSTRDKYNGKKELLISWEKQNDN